jgi:UDP-GlcNAc:undecaprenyl-phosphate GlcNAc-1-phosphate transferase
MLYFAAFITALVVTMALIPPLIHLAGRMHLLDQPNDRKIHDTKIPRIGGIGMVLGVVLTVIIWTQPDREVVSLLAGIAVLFVFGVWDDRGDIDYRLKFLGQFLAAVIVVGYGKVVIAVIPFFGMDAVSPWISIPLTTIALVAVTNAINLADGLDGLAAGTTLLSLAGVAILSYMADGTGLMLVSLVIMGAIAGFLRFNTYPARIFMGDTGSQFLGFTACVLTVILTQKTNPALNPAIPLLLLGLPLFDTLFVMLKRIYHGNSPFSPDKNHTHHQLLALGFDHYEAVIIIYLAQALFVLSGVLFRYQSDLFVITLWAAANVTLALLVVWAGRTRWRAHQPGSKTLLARIMAKNNPRRMSRLSRQILLLGVTLLLFAGPLMTSKVSMDFGIAAAVLLVLLLSRLLFGYHLWFISLRLIMYVAIAFILYLISQYPSNVVIIPATVDHAYFGIIVASLVIGARYTVEDAFRVTPTDFLIILFMIGLALLPHAQEGETDYISLVIKMVIMFYAVELGLRNMGKRWNVITIAGLWALFIIAVRGLAS